MFAAAAHAVEMVCDPPSTRRIGTKTMSESRETLEGLFHSGEIALARSALFDQAPNRCRAPSVSTGSRG